MQIGAYRASLPETLLDRVRKDAEPVPGVPGLAMAPGLRASSPLLTDDALAAVCEVYRGVRYELTRVLDQRDIDLAFVDAQTVAARAANAGVAVGDPAYRTAIGARDRRGRIVVGPRDPLETVAPRVDVPPWAAGPHVALFGPADTARGSIEAMNALSCRRADEPELVDALVRASGVVPRWVADDEDSQTPTIERYLRSWEHLARCLDGSLRAVGADGQEVAIAAEGHARPLKRLPGLALPCGDALFEGEPLPMHVLDLVLHVWTHRTRPDALVIAVPKLETEEEAAYVARLIATTEAAVKLRHPKYRPGSVRVLVVFESPRAIFRIREIAAALSPWFLGGSLGWNDLLASTARLFREDPNHRIPGVGDKEGARAAMREALRVLSRDLGAIGAAKIGGLYRVHADDDDARSWPAVFGGLVRDVAPQLRRGVDGFWVAQIALARPAIALVEAWRRRDADPADPSLDRLLQAMLPDPAELAAARAAVDADDGGGIDPADPLYVRGLLAAAGGRPTGADEEDVRAGVTRALYALTAWLAGAGGVERAAVITSPGGARVAARVTEDLAIVERIRWELWSHVHHRRIAKDWLSWRLAEEEARVARVLTPREDAERWAPIATRLLGKLVTEPAPPELVTELLLPFTLPVIRASADPWGAARRWCPGKYEVDGP